MLSDGDNIKVFLTMKSKGLFNTSTLYYTLMSATLPFRVVCMEESGALGYNSLLGCWCRIGSKVSTIYRRRTSTSTWIMSCAAIPTRRPTTPLRLPHEVGVLGTC
jgi:hypothetical protein